MPVRGNFIVSHLVQTNLHCSYFAQDDLKKRVCSKALYVFLLLLDMSNDSSVPLCRPRNPPREVITM